MKIRQLTDSLLVAALLLSSVPNLAETVLPADAPVPAVVCEASLPADDERTAGASR